MRPRLCTSKSWWLKLVAVLASTQLLFSAQATLHEYHAANTAGRFAAGQVDLSVIAPLPGQGLRLPQVTSLHDDLTLPDWTTDPSIYPVCAMTDPMYHPACMATDPLYEPLCESTDPFFNPYCAQATDPVFDPNCNPDWTNPSVVPFCDMHYTDPIIEPNCAPWTDPLFYYECVIPTDPNFMMECQTDLAYDPICVWKEASEAPMSFGILRNWPNPFNPVTQIEFTLSAASRARLGIYDITGRQVALLVDGMTEAGIQQVAFDGSALSSGVYLALLEADGQRASLRLLLLK